MATSEFELHPDRLATTDAQGRRLFLYPADVKGYFRRQRTRVQAVLIVFFLILPWIRISGKQALLLDIAQRRFEIFGLSLRAHNAPLLILVFASAAFGLFFATAVFGRIWCGWACPQTVFIDGVFRRIERWIEGSALERRKLDNAPADFKKVLKKLAKWVLFVAVTLVLTHSFLAYFIGTDKLAKMMMQPPSENWGSFVFMSLLSLAILFDFTWFREQFCTILCPYGRFQSVLMDKTSMIVSYDTNRGEPRATPQSKALAKLDGSKIGDCVNCYRCVQVCPTGIDIRRGLQMECIACTSCIDACNDVMSKLKKPSGLIRYDSLVPTQKRQQRFGLRAVIYLALCGLSLGSLGLGLASVQPVDMEVLRAKEAPYTTQSLKDGSVIVTNHFKLELSNQSGSEQSLVFSAIAPQGEQEVQLITAIQPLSLSDGKVIQTDVFLRFSKTMLVNGQRRIRLLVRDQNAQTKLQGQIEKEVILVGPFS